MPMRLRDGRFYAPVESHHMILRDGKSVDANQAYIFNTLIRCTIHDTTNRSHWNIHECPYSVSPVKKLQGKSNAIIGTLQNIENVEKVEKSADTNRDSDIVENCYHCHHCQNKSLSFYNKVKQIYLYIALMVIAAKYIDYDPFGIGKLLFRIFAKSLMLVKATAQPFIYIIRVFRKYYSGLSKTIVTSCIDLIMAALYIPHQGARILFHMSKKVLSSSCSVATAFFKQKQRRMTARKVQTNTDLRIPTSQRSTIGSILYVVLTMLPVLIFALLTWRFYSPVHVLLHPNQVGLQNGHHFTLQTEAKIPAWHIIPDFVEKENPANPFNDQSAIILHLRDTGYLDSKHRIGIFKSLSSRGFHIFAPIRPLSKNEILEAWSYLHNNVSHSVIYLWMEEMKPDIVKDLTTDMCHSFSPPAGVIIETKKKNGFSTKRSLEIWSSECKHENMKSKYNFLKCPVTSQIGNDELSNEIATCIHVIAMDTDFKAR